MAEGITSFDREAAYSIVSAFDDAYIRWDIPVMKRAITAMDRYARTFFGTKIRQDIDPRTGRGTIPLGRGIHYRDLFVKHLEASYGARKNFPGTSYRPRE